MYATRSVHNQVTLEGALHLVEILWRIGSAPPPIGPRTWRVGLFTAGAITLTSTAASPGITEFSGFQGNLRPAIDTVGDPATADGTAKIIKGNVDLFLITAAGTITGAFWTTGTQKLGLIGKLWGGANLTAPVTVAPGDNVTVTYTLKAEASDAFGSP